MTVIKKQKFLAELGKLLTFMYAEDRQTALDMYGKLFDDAADEQALLQLLVSPTRQAVVIARNYNSTERKLQIESVHKDDEDTEEGLPDFILAIDKLYQEAVDRGMIVEDAAPAAVLENQVSLFDLDEELFAAEETEAEAEAPAQEIEEEPAEEEAPAEEPTEEEPTEEEPTEEEREPMDEVDAFLASFSIVENELEPAAEPEAAKDEATEEAAVEEAPAAPVEEQTEQVKAPAEAKPVRKAKVFLLILYILIAVPLTAVGVALLLIPTLLVLALAAVVITGGVAALIAAFSGFAVFADILIVLGAALIILALGLLLLWLFVWLVGGAIVGLIHGVITLGGKWCFKEVPAV